MFNNFLKNILKEKADFARRVINNIVDAKKLDCIVTPRPVIVYNIKKTSLRSNEKIRFCVASKIK
jgi:hypothetical protein